MSSAFAITGSRIARSLATFLILAAAACSSAPPARGPAIATPQRPDVEAPAPGETPAEEATHYDPRGFVEPFHMTGDEPVRVGLLLPFTAPNEAARRIAAAMFDAAQLAAFDAGDRRFLILPKDTRGDAEGAAAAARSALADGAEILLGPLFSEEVRAVADVARAAETPVIAFSSDLAVGGDGVYLLSFPPEIEVARVTDYAVLQGLTRFGLIAPATEYGERVSAAFAEEIYVRGGVLVHEERYEQDPDKMLAPARRLAQYAGELVPAELRHGYDPNAAPQNPAADEGYVRGYQAVLMPEQGTLLRALAPLLPYFNVDITQVKLLGLSGWNNARLTREPALRGGWFAAPDPTVTAAFDQRFEAAFGQKPPRLASLAYDATLLAARLGQAPRRRGRFDAAALADPNGYFGADGLFRLNPDGSIDRGLAILEIQPGGIRVIDPAPRSFAVGF
ncbi:penicillin-binding protein activator [Amphiplicatus metriothermophilus]|uniref:Amino acid/amide ABC transporter substrate-binding protein, HAAT family n=1 Tax=Amphiplicatus metriothermophilus TaxID=1519374 RepID=A0A239PKW3_9PROT|nr:penicillin-binding protein activator [Amphiplicatus metriothermophilus]MBB5517693.1 ABC-type branched-subunit amino acid transport system substrate-binding protein [Amphiplicatus metriothermophilus]SNT67973.1 amino acid/amide ABC transporter substrate-binding protein, HAAT family [Amphiplicatus metriothermophilus]